MRFATKSYHPQDEANFVSKILFWWIFPLLWKGARNPLKHEDLYPIREVDKSDLRTDHLEEKWREEIQSAHHLGREPKLWRALFRYYTFWEYWYFVPSGLAYLLGENIVWLSTINLLRHVTNYHDNESRDEYYIYIYGIAIGSLIKYLGQNHLHLQGAFLGVRARAAILSMLYRKVLRLSKLSLDSGHVMELVCNDSQRIIFTSAEWFIPYTVRHALNNVCVIVWLVYFIGWQIIPGASFLVTLGVIRVLLNQFDYKLRKKASELSDKRLGIIRETLTIIQSLKVNSWEEIYENMIRKTRWEEIKFKTKRWMMMLTCYSFTTCGQHLGTFITVLVLIFTQRENIPHLNFFALLTLFRELSEKQCMCLPTSIRYITDVRTALKRIEIFLKQKDSFSENYNPKTTTECNDTNIPDTVTEDIAKTPLFETQTGEHEKIFPPRPLTINQPYLHLNKVTCELAAGVESNCAEILNDVTLNITTPGLVLVCGPVGSGKTSLLTTVLGGELPVTSGFVKYSGNIAYVSDSPWVFPGTIRENILFGLPYEEKLYVEVIKACQLEKDFKTFPQQDLAVVGEHGATVSGGQRTRISLARAVYSQADIYLLDDPLSSLDAQVAENVFWQCIKGLLADRIVLLTTHATRYHQDADHIIRLKDGKIEELRDELPLAESELDQENATPNRKKARDVWLNASEPGGKASSEVVLPQQEEERETGRVAFKVYKEYFLYGASAIVMFIIALIFFSGQGLIVLVDIKASRLPQLAGQGKESFHHALMAYALCVLAGVVLVVVGTLFIFLVFMNAAYKVHNKMVTCLLKAPLSFHAVNPVGQVINRFSQDMNNLDELLPFYMFVLCLYAGPAIATIILAGITTPFLVIPIFITLPVFYFISKVFFTSATDIKRLMSIAGSPIYSHFSNTMEGLRTIRVYRRQNDFTDQLFRDIDDHHRAVLCSYTAVRWFANVFSIACAVLATIIISIAVQFITDSLSTALCSVTILYAVNTTSMMDYALRVLSYVNSQMTSAERVLAYTRIQPEHGQDFLKTPPENWPPAGAIEFRDVSLWHYTGGPKALKNISFKINPSEKLGIAGRTGAGKSSLVAALMRLGETQGKILIDGLNINDFNVLSTRKCMSVISQLPTLINGTIRLNLDPSGQHTDTEIWQALNRTKMSSAVKNLPKKLDSQLDIGSLSFSVGEIQLLNLARVLLQNNNIVIFDEATGKIDGNTDKEIQKIIDEAFKKCTVITIAHRLSTILDSDRVMVLDQGEIMEFDRPDVLMNRPKGLLRQLQDILA